MTTDLVVVTGAGGFIGGHLVGSLIQEGARVRAVDCKPLEQWHQASPYAANQMLDLSRADACEEALRGATSIYNLTAEMGGENPKENAGRGLKLIPPGLFIHDERSPSTTNNTADSLAGQNNENRRPQAMR